MRFRKQSTIIRPHGLRLPSFFFLFVLFVLFFCNFRAGCNKRGVSFSLFTLLFHAPLSCTVWLKWRPPCERDVTPWSPSKTEPEAENLHKSSLKPPSSQLHASPPAQEMQEWEFISFLVNFCLLNCLILWTLQRVVCKLCNRKHLGSFAELVSTEC